MQAKASQDFNVLFPNCYEDAEGSSQSQNRQILGEK